MIRTLLRMRWAKLGVSALGAVGAATLIAARGPARHVVVERYPNGVVMRSASYRGDVLDGPTRGWYESGAPMLEYNYSNGLSEGTQRQWFPTGQSFSLFHHHEGRENGQQQLWNADGTIRSNYVIKDDRRFGLLGAMGCTGKGKPVSGDMQ